MLSIPSGCGDCMCCWFLWFCELEECVSLLMLEAVEDPCDYNAFAEMEE